MTKLRMGIYALSFSLFGLFCYFAHQLLYFPSDISVSLWLQRIDIPFLNPIMQGVSSWVLAGIIVVLLVVGLLILGRRLEAVFVTSLVIIAGLASWLLKELISRPRPSGELIQLLEVSSGPSFPSTHATCAIVFCGFLFYLAPKLVRQPIVAWVLRSLLITLILLTGVSRIYLGAHWTSDVLGGLFLGGLLLYPAIALYKNYAAKQKRPS